MMKKELSYFVNLNEFPIHDSDNSKYKKIVQEAREALSLDGCYVLKSIINMEAIYEMQKEASKIENLAHYTTNKVNVFFLKMMHRIQKIILEDFLWNVVMVLFQEINFLRIL